MILKKMNEINWKLIFKEMRIIRFKKETLRVGMDWLKNNQILKNGFFLRNALRI